MYERLLANLPKPLTPVETGTLTAWIQAELQLGLVLPDDYKFFISTYGTGMIGELFIVLNPFAKNSNYNLLSELKLYGEMGQILREDFNASIRFEAYPSEGGVLPWAVSLNGDIVAWKVNSRFPHHTELVLMTNRFDAYEMHCTSTTDFILYLLSTENKSRILPRHLFKAEAKFEVYDQP